MTSGQTNEEGERKEKEWKLFVLLCHHCFVPALMLVVLAGGCWPLLVVGCLNRRLLSVVVVPLPVLVMMAGDGDH